MDIVSIAQENYEKDKSAWSDIFIEAKKDIDFMSDDLYAQWDARDAAMRASDRNPVLTVDQLSQFIHQVANDIRMNTPAIGVLPSGDDSSVETAEVFKGLIRNIEYVSQADDAYDMAAECAVRCSIGWITLDNSYIDDESFDQELSINRVIDPFAVFIDGESTEIDGRDARRGYILRPMAISEFKEKYPDLSPVSFGEKEVRRNVREGEFLDICYYYEIEETEKEKAMLSDGSVVDYSEELILTEGITVKTRRKVKSKKVKCYVLSGADVLEESIFPGKYIPIVPVYGEEMWNRGQRRLHSLIRRSKDSQMMYNLWKSIETELLLKQPNAPFMAQVGTVEEFAEDWKNPAKTSVLRYKGTDTAGNPTSAPQRVEPPIVPMGIVNASRATIEDIKSTMGIYNASLGQRSNETSGIAIARRQEEGSVATYHFADNLNKSITHVGRILVCAIPEVYDSSRVIRIIDEEENPKEIGINGMMVDKQELDIDLTKGKYDVKIIPGASYTTRRQEAAQFYGDIVTRQPELMKVMGDLLFKYMDFSGSQAMAERMKKVIDPKFLEDDNEKEYDPEKEQMSMAIQQSQAVIQELTGRIGQMETELKSKQAELMIKAKSEENNAEYDMAKIDIDRLKLEIEQQKLLIEREKVQTDRMKVEGEGQYKIAALALREYEINTGLAQSEINNQPLTEVLY